MYMYKCSVSVGGCMGMCVGKQRTNHCGAHVPLVLMGEISINLPITS